MRRTSQANLREGKKEKHVLKYDDVLNDHDDVSSTRNSSSTEKKKKVTLQYDDKLYDNEDKNTISRSAPEGESAQKKSERSALNSARNMTTVGDYRVPNCIRRNKENGVEEHRILSDANVSQADTPVGAFRVQPGAYVPPAEHHNDDGTTSGTSSLSNTATVGAFRVPNYLQRNKKDDVQHQLEISDPLSEPTNESPGAFHVVTGDQISKKEDKHRLEIRDSLAEPDGKTTQNVANMNHQLDSTQPNAFPGAHRNGGSNQDDDDGINTVCNYQDHYNQQFSEMQPQQQELPKCSIDRVNDEDSSQSSANEGKSFTPNEYLNANTKKLWPVLIIVIAVIVAVSWGGVHIFASIDEGEKSSKLQRVMNELTDIIVSKLPISEEALGNKSSSQYEALLWVAEKKVEDPEFYTDNRLLRQYSLVTFFKSTNYKLDFSEEYDECEWTGVVCNQESKALSLVIHNEILIGSLPPDIALLPLVNLILDNNKHLTGPIPTEIGLLSKILKIRISGNELSGAIPSEIGLLSKIQVIRLNDNKLEGPIPSEIGLINNTNKLNVESNSINGAIPSEIGLLSHLAVLSLSRNNLSGSIPSEIGLLKKIATFGVIDNELTGKVPSEIWLMNQLIQISLEENNLTGSIPSEIKLLSRLEFIDLKKNNFVGFIPSEIGLLKLNLADFQLNNNKLQGPIPSELGQLSKLSTLFLDSNILTGFIPTEIGHLGELTRLNLELNQLSGSIPTEIGLLEKVNELRLTDNLKLTGTIPDTICEAKCIVVEGTDVKKPNDCGQRCI
eukprot:CAMPEP_0194131210 /NCGR_PEP_ID=MMETSP0152-20130528/2017_1 /TAXON_ID=1049557 /ORGANISM="Thalassiothrix antarctica, Strain L6-D1" /LENGTH=783 /DNA_ID=CAMNT_0038825915 /DNA_START=179 /DNA_END=2530 /DNA_ORIENTATION=-